MDVVDFSLSLVDGILNGRLHGSLIFGLDGCAIPTGLAGAGQLLRLLESREPSEEESEVQSAIIMGAIGEALEITESFTVSIFRSGFDETPSRIESLDSFGLLAIIKSPKSFQPSVLELARMTVKAARNVKKKQNMTRYSEKKEIGFSKKFQRGTCSFITPFIYEQGEKKP